MIMELDLNSFLVSHSSSDSDTEGNLVQHRTLDEILEDSYSSTPESPPPPTPPLMSGQPRLPVPPCPLTNRRTRCYTEAPKPTKSQSLDAESDLAKPILSSRGYSAGGSWGDPSWSLSPSCSPFLKPLLRGLKSNAKPGAALAAATAASRLVPSSHATEMKPRNDGRDPMNGFSSKPIDDGESGFNTVEDLQVVSNSSNEEFYEISTVGSVSGGRSVEDYAMANFQSSPGPGSEIMRSEGHLGGTHEALVNKDQNLSCVTQPYLDTITSKIQSSINPICVVTDDENVFVDANTKLSDESYSNEISIHPCEIEDKDSDDYSQTVLHSEEHSLKGHKHSLESGPGPSDDATFDGDDGNSTIDMLELVEERMEQLQRGNKLSLAEERINKKEDKKLEVLKKPLELAEELEKELVSTGLHWEEGVASKPMRLQGVTSGSVALGYFDVDAKDVVTRIIESQAFLRDHGSSQVLAVHLKYIALGTAKGVIIVFTSRYSSHDTDNIDEKVSMLGMQADHSQSPVTSICFNQLGDLLLAGYGDGHVALWNVQKSSLAKIITGMHAAPVVHTFFLGQDTQVTRQFKAVTGDSKGLVLLHAFTGISLLNMFSVSSQRLLDGQKTGVVLSASTLVFDQPSRVSSSSSSSISQSNSSVSSGSIGSMMGGIVGGDASWKLFNEGSSVIEEGVVIFVTHQVALVARLCPTVEVYGQISKPDGVRDGGMPYTAWKCAGNSSAGELVENDSAEASERASLLAIAWDRRVQVAKLVKSELVICGKWFLDHAAIGVAWLDAHILIVLTCLGQLFLFTKDGTLIHTTSFSPDGFGGDDLVGYHTHFVNMYGNPIKCYHNCVAIRGVSVYILGPTQLIVARFLLWKERILALRRAGDWMGALNMAVTLFDGEVHSVIDLPKSVDAIREAIMPCIVELLLSYVEEVFSYVSVAFRGQIGREEQDFSNIVASSENFNIIKEQFTVIGEVAVEFCTHIQRTDILFDEIFAKFVTFHQKGTFLEVLEPYILKDILGSLPPEIMQALVEYYSGKGWLQRVEQCILHMNISSLDFNQVVRLCREHGLYGALVYLFNKGLDDFRTPLEELLIVSQSNHIPRIDATTLGYKMLVYLKHCFSGFSFPPGHGLLPPTRVPSVRTELLQFLLENSVIFNSTEASSLFFGGTYPNLYHLLELDTEATLDALSCAFVDEENQGSDAIDEGRNDLLRDVIDALVRIIERCQGQISPCAVDTSSLESSRPSRHDVACLSDFILRHVLRKNVPVSASLLAQLVHHLTSEAHFSPASSTRAGTPKEREKQLIELLKAVPPIRFDSSLVLQLCHTACFHQACGMLYENENEYVEAVDSYMKDVDEPIHAFSFVVRALERLSGDDCDSFKMAVMSRIPDLFVLNREAAFFLVLDKFSNETACIISQLRPHLKGLYFYLKTAIEVHLSGTLSFAFLTVDEAKGHEAYRERISQFPKLLQSNPVHVTDDLVELYFELLCQYEPGSVLKFLETFDSYRVEYCLRLCQNYGIVDAAAFLLERVGDAGNALFLVLSDLNNKFWDLDEAVGKTLLDVGSDGNGSVEHYNALLKTKEVGCIFSLLHASVGLCQRNSPRLDPEEAETIWFSLLDSFCNPLMDSHSNGIAKGKNHVLGLAEDPPEVAAGAGSRMWKISKSRLGVRVLKKLFSQFIKEIIMGMIGYVHLSVIMSKLLADSGGQEFGDFKYTMLEIIGIFGFERRILDTARFLMEDDTFYTISLLKKGMSRGYAPQRADCCVCNGLLAKGSPDSEIRVSSCGHAMHLECEILESESAGEVPSSSGCPICMPKKEAQRRGGDEPFISENGLVGVMLPASQRGQIKHLLPAREDFMDNLSVLQQQISRFEMLTNLQKDPKLIRTDSLLPQLKLAARAVYHEKVKRVPVHLSLSGERSSGPGQADEPSLQLGEMKMKAASLQFPLKGLPVPLKASFFGKGRTKKV